MKISESELRMIIHEEVRKAKLQEGIVQDMEAQPEALQRLLVNMSGHRAELADRIADLSQEIAELRDLVASMQRNET
jgi:hypothetical protein